MPPQTCKNPVAIKPLPSSHPPLTPSSTPTQSICSNLLNSGTARRRKGEPNTTPTQNKLNCPMDPKSRPTPAGQLVYEDFEPQYQWVPGKDADTLVVNLTEFKDEAEYKREHLKVKIDNYGNLKVSGERPLGGGNRWRRFQKVLRMAEDCITAEIKAKLDNGVLTVSMPKLIKDPASSTPQQPSPAAAQAPGAAPAAPPAKPEPRAAKAPEERKAQVAAPSEHRRRDTARDKEGGPAAEKPAPPQALKSGTGTRRRWRQVLAGVVVVMVVAAVGLGFYYYWGHWNGISTDEQEQMDICLSDY